LVDRLDHLRIQILGLISTGDAGEWFNQTVEVGDSSLSNNAVYVVTASWLCA
jgi:hypothetical protein